jgi:hypothetical protein
MAAKAEGGLFFPKIFFSFFAAIILVFVLKELQQIFIPFFIALFFYFMLNDLVRKLGQRKIPKSLILIGLLLLIFICLFLFGLLIFNGASSFIDNFPAYSEKITRLAKGMLASLKLPIVDVEKYIANIDWGKTFDPGQITVLVSGTIGNFTTFVGNLLLVLLLLMFMLGEKVPMITRIARALSPERGEELQRIMAAIDGRVRHYLFIKTLMGLITAVLAALILLWGHFFSPVDLFIEFHTDHRIPPWDGFPGADHVSALRIFFAPGFGNSRADGHGIRDGQRRRAAGHGQKHEPFTDHHRVFPDLLGLAVGRGRDVSGRSRHFGAKDHFCKYPGP